MHLLQVYSLGSSSAIGKPYIFTKFFPIPVEKYITIHPTTKFSAKCYDLWKEVVEILYPILNKAGISMVQIGQKEDVNLPFCVRTSGQTSIGQVSYILQNSMLHCGIDSFPVHVASGLNKKIVALYSNTLKEIAKPYWGNPNDHVLLESDKLGKKASFAADENPKTINSIKPELIAESVCKLLGLPFTYEYKTLGFGSKFSPANLFELVPNQVIDIKGLAVDSIIVRMDYLFNEQVLHHQLNASNCSIVTNRPINLGLLSNFKPRIKEVVYFLDEKHDPSFVEAVQKLGIPLVLLSELPENEVQKLKFYYMDFGIIHRQIIYKKESFKFLENTDSAKLFYKSNKFTLSEGKIFNCKSAWLQNKPMAAFSSDALPIIDDDEFWKEADFFYFLTQ